MRCPKCNSPRLHRSRPRSRREQRLRFWLPVRHYRCHGCNYRALRVTPRAVGQTVVRHALPATGGVLAWHGLRALLGFLLRY